MLIKRIFVEISAL